MRSTQQAASPITSYSENTHLHGNPQAGSRSSTEKGKMARHTAREICCCPSAYL